MAAPNVVNVTDIKLPSVSKQLTGSATDFLENPAGSGKVYKVDTLEAVNFDAAVNYDVTVSLYKAATAVTLVWRYVTVPFKSAIQLNMKSFDLEEGDKFTAFGSTTLKINLFGSYSVIDD